MTGNKAPACFVLDSNRRNDVSLRTNEVRPAFLGAKRVRKSGIIQPGAQIEKVLIFNAFFYRPDWKFGNSNKVEKVLRRMPLPSQGGIAELMAISLRGSSF